MNNEQINFVDDVNAIFESIEPNSSTCWHVSPVSGTDSTDIQRYKINMALRMKIMQISLNNPSPKIIQESVEVRYCILDIGDLVSWMALLRDKVAPFIIRKRL